MVKYAVCNHAVGLLLALGIPVTVERCWLRSFENYHVSGAGNLFVFNLITLFKIKLKQALLYDGC